MTPLQQFSLEAARKYLQSVVFVDDKIFDEGSGLAVEAVEDLPKPRKKIYEPDHAPVDVAAQVDDVGAVRQDAEHAEDSYRPKDLVSSFAREGIICALYEPPEEFEVEPDSDIFKLCERPDIIILDWDLSGDEGRKTLDLIAALVKQSREDFPHHTRLLAIYTIDPSLEGVANQIGDRLTKEGFPPEPERSPCRLQSGATRIIVFGKNKKRIGKEEEEFTVKEQDLASRLIQEFAEMNSGILPAYALHGMAAIRRNSKRILERFHGNMNGAFLLHRAFSMASEEAFDQLPALLAEELEAVLDDNRINPTDASSIATDAISQLRFQSPRSKWYSVTGLPFPATRSIAIEVTKQILEEGRVTTEKYPEIREVIELASGFHGINASLMRDLMAVVDSDQSESNQRLAALFSNRTHYDESKRHLMYGTIIRRRQPEGVKPNWIYSFCLMPVCDSLRLDQSRQHKAGSMISFPFWKLREDVLTDSNVPRRGLAALLPDKSYALLSAGGKARDMLWVGNFDFNVATGTVTANRNADGRFLFTADQHTEVEWIAELKPLHSQRIAHDIAQGLSRVGLVEAEWLRLVCDR